MPVAIDEVVGTVDSETPPPREQESQVPEPKQAELERLREKMRRLESRAARVRAN